MKSIPYGRQSVTQEDIDAVAEVLRSDYLTTGPRVKEFEEAFARYIGARYAVAVSNGTAALHLSAMALNVQPGDKVITTPITFSASANCIRYCGGEAVFVDIDPETYLMDLQALENLLKAHPKGTFRGVIPVDFSGRAVDLQKVKALADTYGLFILEDACHAPGGYFRDSSGVEQHCGNGAYADCAIFSFHPVKHIACGEGGMITTNSEEMYKHLLSLRSHGMIYQGNEKLLENHGPWYMELQELGYNYRMPDILCALGLSQLGKAEEGLARRREIAAVYYEAFKNKPFVKGQSGVVEGHAYHLYILEVENRLELYNYLRENKIFAQIHYVPVHLMPYYRQFGWKKGDFPHAEKYYEHCISLPVYPALTAEEQVYVIEKICTFYS